jgi:flagellar protein FliT
MSALTPNQVIATYEKVTGVMASMRAAARAADWTRLAALEKDCARLVALLQHSPVSAELTPPQQQRKFDLLKRLLADDAEIRRHTEPWMENLKSLIHSTGRKRQISQAYGLGANPAPGSR